MSGSQQGLDLCARLLLDPGDRVLIENPCYNLAWHVFAAAGARSVALPVDEDGIRTDGLRPARLAYVTPSHQFPLGSVLSAARRMELLAWARANGSYVIEDDYDGEYRYDIRPVPPLYAMDGGGSTIYIGTVSKTLSPTLRLGYLVVPKALFSVITGLKRLSDRHAPSGTAGAGRADHRWHIRAACAAHASQERGAARRPARCPRPPHVGHGDPCRDGWSTFFTGFEGSDQSNPAGHLALKFSGPTAWFGWPSNPKIEELRDQWLVASEAEQPAICRDLQLQAFQSVPYIPLGQSFTPSAYLSNLVDLLDGPAKFWNVRRA